MARTQKSMSTKLNEAITREMVLRRHVRELRKALRDIVDFGNHSGHCSWISSEGNHKCDCPLRKGKEALGATEPKR